MQADELVQGALARAVLDKSSKELRDALVAEVWAQHQEELLQKALEQVRTEQEGTLEALKERLRGRIAEERHAMEREVTQIAEADKNREMAEERQEFEERRLRLINQRNMWKSRATAAEAWIADHIKQLFPDGQEVLLRDPEIRQFKLYSANAILTSVGLKVKSRLTDTPQVVATEVGPQRWEQQSRFKLVTVALGAIDEEEDEDAGAVAEASPDGSTV
jgi:hypothetical protein